MQGLDLIDEDEKDLTVYLNDSHDYDSEISADVVPGLGPGDTARGLGGGKNAGGEHQDFVTWLSIDGDGKIRRNSLCVAAEVQQEGGEGRGKETEGGGPAAKTLEQGDGEGEEKKDEEESSEGHLDSSSSATQALTPGASPASSIDFNASSVSTSDEAGRTEECVGIECATDASDASNDIASEGGSRTMEVAVTLLSLHGLVAKRNAPSGRKLLRKSSSGGQPSVDDKEHRVVASFVASKSKDNRDLLTHVPSLPVPVTAVSVDSAGDDVDDGATRPAVHWPPYTLQFKRKFVREGGGFKPQTCPIDLSISRNGEMALLGRADIVVGMEEAGDTPVAITVRSSIRPRRRASLNGSFKVKKRRSSLAAASSKFREPQNQGSFEPGGESRRGLPTVRIGGDAYRFGLESPVLRATVSVRDLGDSDDGEGSPAMGGDGGGDISTLRRRLAQSETDNEALRGALADANKLCARQQGEIDQLRAQLTLASHNAQALLSELGGSARDVSAGCEV